jgi:hypothetical protein
MLAVAFVNLVLLLTSGFISVSSGSAPVVKANNPRAQTDVSAHFDTAVSKQNIG